MSIPITNSIPNRPTMHPGELLREMLEDLAVSQSEFARATGMPIQRVNQIIRGKRAVTPETAWILAGATGTDPQSWLNLQTMHDLTRTRPSKPTKLLPAVKARRAA
jgi:addiction module HigA family antidote